MITVQFKKDYAGFTKGQITEVTSNEAFGLIDDGICKVYAGGQRVDNTAQNVDKPLTYKNKQMRASGKRSRKYAIK